MGVRNSMQISIPGGRGWHALYQGFFKEMLGERRAQDIFGEAKLSHHSLPPKHWEDIIKRSMSMHSLIIIIHIQYKA